MLDADTAVGRAGRDIVNAHLYTNLNENTMARLVDIELTKRLANPNRLNNLKLEPHVCRHTCGVAIPGRQQHGLHERVAALTLLIWIEHERLKVHERTDLVTSNVPTMHLHA